jgi:hypothetical protein
MLLFCDLLHIQNAFNALRLMCYLELQIKNHSRTADIIRFQVSVPRWVHRCRIPRCKNLEMFTMVRGKHYSRN